MTRGDISLLAVRLLALYLIADGISRLPGLTMLPHVGDYREDITRLAWLTWGFAIILPVCLGLLALLFSRALAWSITPRRAEEEPLRAGLSDVQSAATGTFGLLLLAVTLPQLITSIAMHQPTRPNTKEEVSLFDDAYFVAEFATTLMALFLCTGAGLWVRMIRSFRNLGWKEA